MADEIIAPLMPDSNNEEDNNYEISTSEDFHDNENENLLDNNRRENENNNRIIVREFSIHQKKGFIYLSYSLQTLLFFMSLYYLSDYMNKSNFIKHNLNILYYISIFIMCLIIIAGFYFHLNLIREPLILIFPIALISTLSIFFILYKLSILFSFKIMANLMIISIIIYINLFFINYFINVANQIEEAELFFSVLIPFWLFPILLFEDIRIGVIINMILIIFIMEIYSIVIMDALPHSLYKNYLIMHIVFHIDIFITFIIYGLCYLDYQREMKKRKKIKSNKSKVK